VRHETGPPTFHLLPPPMDTEFVDRGKHGWGRSAPTQFWPGDGKAARFRQIYMALTHGGGNIYLTCSSKREIY